MYLKIGEVARQLSVTTQSLRVWEKKGIFLPHHVNDSGTRFYTQEQIDTYLGKIDRTNEFKVVGYCRVSSPSQKDDLERQVDIMNTYLKYRYDKYSIIKDIGSGIHYNKKGLHELIKLINNKEIDRIVILHKDRLVRFGFELIEYIASLNDIDIKIIEDDEEKTNEQELSEDLIQIITVFSARLNDKRAHQNKLIRDKLESGD